MDAITEAKINKVSSSILCGFLRGTARATEVTGKAIGITGGVTGAALVAAGTAIGNGSRTVENKSKQYAEKLRNKASQYDLSHLTEEELTDYIEDHKEEVPV